MHEVLVNRLGRLSLPRESVVRLTDRPDMTLDVYRGRKTTIQHCIQYSFGYKAGFSLFIKYPKYENQLCVIQLLERFFFSKTIPNSRSVLKDRSRVLSCFGEEKLPFYNLRNMVSDHGNDTCIFPNHLRISHES